MSASHSASRAYRCSFELDREDLYLRLGTVKVFVRDQERSLRFFVEQLGFQPALDVRGECGDRWLTVTPPDGTATVALVAPEPGSEECALIGGETDIVFLTEDVFATCREWRYRGVRFRSSPQQNFWGATSASFEDIDGNLFTLSSFEGLTRELEELRRAQVEKQKSQRRIELERESAREVQARLFPRTRPALTSLEYTGCCIQAREVGGDYYDFIDLGREHVGLVIGDVAGKGTAAALLMANLQAHLHNQCATYWSRPFTPFALEQPQRFLVAVNRLFGENTGENSYATLFFAEYEDRTRGLRYANCGHPPGILLRRDDEVERLDSTSTVLGLFKELDCGVGHCNLFPGDTLALYTDGLTEAFNREGEEFGEERLIDILRRGQGQNSEELLTSLVEDVRKFSPHEQHDDITLLIARCRSD